jgi:hypothetical protein
MILSGTYSVCLYSIKANVSDILEEMQWLVITGLAESNVKTPSC